LNAAESFLREHRLLGDSIMRSLLEIQRSTDNPIKSRELTLSLSTEVKRVINIVAKLSSRIPAFLDAEGNYRNVTREATEYSLIVQVNF